MGLRPLRASCACEMKGAGAGGGMQRGQQCPCAHCPMPLVWGGLPSNCHPERVGTEEQEPAGSLVGSVK